MGNPIDDTKQVCAYCRRLFEPDTGELAKGLEQIKIYENGKDLCKPCTSEREGWPHG